MASFLFLRNEFDNALVYLTSVKVGVSKKINNIMNFLFSTQGFFFNDDTFNFNFAQAKASVGQYQEAQEVWLNSYTCISSTHFFHFQIFQQVSSDEIKNSYTYISWLARCCKSTRTNRVVVSCDCLLLILQLL